MRRLESWFPGAYAGLVPASYLRVRCSLALGWVATALMGICLVTGLLLAFHFRPDPREAYASIADVVSVVAYGRLVRNLHRFAAEGLIVVAVLHLLRVLLTRSYTGPRAANWSIGVCLLVLILLANFTGYVMPWDQTAYWGLTVCASIVESVPAVGPAVRGLLIGAGPPSETALTRLYVLHVLVVPVALVVLVARHRRRFRRDCAVRADGEQLELVPAWPQLWHWELAALLGSLAVLTVLATHVQAPLAGPANPHEPPNPAKAPWYFLWLQELASHVSAPRVVLLAVLLLGFTILLPWLAGPSGAGGPSRPRVRLVEAAFLGICAVIACLNVIALAFRGPNWSFVVPWR